MKSPEDGWEMAGWLPLGISKDCGCNPRSLHNGSEMIGWLAPTSSKDVGCNCRSPRDVWEMAGWLALAMSKDFGCHFGSLEDGRENTCCIITQNTATKPSVQQKPNQYTTKWLGGWLLPFRTQSGVNRHRQEMAGRWVGRCPWVFPKITV